MGVVLMSILRGNAVVGQSGGPTAAINATLAGVIEGALLAKADGIIETLYDYLTGNYFGKSVPTIEESCYNHLITFAAEESRRTQKVVNFEEYVKSF
jgi:hypothetical protein